MNVLQVLVHFRVTSAPSRSNISTIWLSINVFIVAKNRSSVKSAENDSLIPDHSLSIWTTDTTSALQIKQVMVTENSVHRNPRNWLGNLFLLKIYKVAELIYREDWLNWKTEATSWNEKLSAKKYCCHLVCYGLWWLIVEGLRFW